MALPVSNKEWFTVKHNSTTEFIEKRSRFICHVIKVYTEKQAIQEIAGIRNEYPDARHNTYAYTVKEGDVLYQRFSDDGEPQGTAGMPILEVVNHNDLENVLIVVTRYFGGILLGTGGLVRAYSKSAALGIKAAFKVRRMLCTVLSIDTDYSSYEKIKRLLSQFVITDTVFGDSVHLELAVDHLTVDSEVDRIYELVNNKCKIEKKSNIFLEK